MTEGWSIEVNGREVTNRVARVSLLVASHVVVALAMFLAAIFVIVAAPVLLLRKALS